MTDLELIELLEHKTPAELTPQEVNLLRSRLRESSAVAKALQERLLIDQSLNQVLGEIHITPDQVLARQQRPHTEQNNFKPWLWVIAFGLVFVVGYFLQQWLLPGPRDQLANQPVQNPEQVNQGQQAQPVDKTKISDPSTQPQQPGTISLNKQNQLRPNWIVIEAKQALQLENIELATEEQFTFLRHIDKDQAAGASFLVVVPTDGNYYLDLQYRSLRSQPIQVLIDGQSTGKDWHISSFPALTNDPQENWMRRTIPLTSGQHTIRIQTGKRNSSRYQAWPELQRIAIQQTSVIAAAEQQMQEDSSPWLGPTQLGAKPRPLQELALEPVREWGPRLARLDFKSWFRTVDGLRLETGEYFGAQVPHVTGRAILKTPLELDQVLRLALRAEQGLQINCWDGTDGYSFRYYPSESKTWVVYHVTRETPKRISDAKIKTIEFASSDLERFLRMQASDQQTRLELSYTQEQLQLSSAGLLLCTAPWDQGNPPEVQIEFRGNLYGLALNRLEPTPSSERDLTPPVTTTWAKPAEQNWKFQQIPQAVKETTEDGAIILKTTARTEQPCWLTTDLNLTAPALIDAELEVSSSRGMLILSPNDTNPRYALAAIKDRNSSQILWRLTNPFDGTRDDESRPTERVTPITNQRIWVRLVQGCGVVRAWLSLDGEQWGRALYPMFDTDGGCTKLGLMIPPSDEACSITLHQVRIRQLSGLEQGLQPEALTLKPVITNFNSESEWLAEVRKTKPANVSEDLWTAAASWQTITLGHKRQVSHAQLMSRLEQLLFPLPDKITAEQLEQRLQLLDTVAWIAHTQHTDDAYTANQRFALLHLRLANELLKQGQTQVWSRIWPRWTRSPYWAARQSSEQWQNLARSELFETLYQNQPLEVRRMNRWLSIIYPQLPLTNWIDRWITTNHPELQPAIKFEPDRRDREQLRNTYRHPLIEEINKENFNTLAEIHSALGSKAYRDACQIISQSSYSEGPGLLPDQTDRQLLLSLPAAIRLAMQQDAELQQFMRDELNQVGNLRYRKAELNSDVQAMQALTTQYYGTVTAGSAHQWLGERALSGGNFGAARRHFSLAQETLPVEQTPQLAAKVRLAAALAGDQFGSPVTQPITIAGTTIEPAEFEQLIQEQVKTALTHDHSSSSQLPRLSELQIAKHGVIDGTFGTSTTDQPTLLDQALDRPPRLDWVARTSQLTPLGERVLFNNRYQAALYELKSGKRIWQTMHTQPGRTHDWLLTPMRPLIQQNRLFVRRLARTGPELAALDLEQGKLLWQTGTELTVIADPLWVNSLIQVLAISRNEQDSQILWLTIDPTTGNVMQQRTLVTVRTTWDEHRTAQWTYHAGLFYGNLTGMTFCCDEQGRVRWLRKHYWLSAKEEPNWPNQSQQPPMLRANKLVTVQPGVVAVECLQPETGQLLWRAVQPNWQRIIGISDELVLIQTTDGVYALSLETGLKVWSYENVKLFETSLLTDNNTKLWLFATESIKPNDEKQQGKQLVLDVKTGKIVDTLSVPSWNGERFYLGGVVPVSEQAWWLMFTEGDDKPQPIIWEIK